MRVQEWHDEAERWHRTGQLDQGPCWCEGCVAVELGASEFGEDERE